MSKTELANLARVEAKSLYHVAAFALALISIGALAGIALGVWVMFRGADPNLGVGAALAGSSLIGWAISAVPSFAGMAVARYIGWRVS